jgi:hypothetical protein
MAPVASDADGNSVVENYYQVVFSLLFLAHVIFNARQLGRMSVRRMCLIAIFIGSTLTRGALQGLWCFSY